MFHDKIGVVLGRWVIRFYLYSVQCEAHVNEFADR
jgi:hypothetical protein